MGETFQLYVKNTSNCQGLPLQTFERLGQEWIGESLRLPFGPADEPRRVLEIVGWTDLFTGRPCVVHVARVRWLPSVQPEITGGPDTPQEGYLIWGGNSGVRALDPNTEPGPGTDHLPPGWGYPIIWVAPEDVDDLPSDVRGVAGYPERDPDGLKVFDCPSCGTGNAVIEDEAGFRCRQCGQDFPESLFDDWRDDLEGDPTAPGPVIKWDEECANPAESPSDELS